jgi:hypothetical protein
MTATQELAVVILPGSGMHRAEGEACDQPASGRAPKHRAVEQ